MAVLAHNCGIVSNLAIEHNCVGPVGWHVANEAHKFGIFRVVLGQVGDHLDGRIDDDVERKLLCGSRQYVGIAASFQTEYPRGEVHRAAKHAREDQVCFMLGRILGTTPRVILHAALSLAAHPVGIGPPEACVLDRFMRVDRNMIARRCFDNLEVMPCRCLPLMPIVNDVAITSKHFEPTGIGHITGLDTVDAQRAVERERRVHLAFVMSGVGRGFMMADQRHALFAAVVGDGFEIEIVIGLSEAEIFAIGEPVAVPAFIPAFDQQSGEAVCRRKVDHLPGIGVRRAVLGSGSPTLPIKVHTPPDADKFARMDPAYVAQLVGLVEVQD